MRNVFVSGTHKRLFDVSGALLPPAVQAAGGSRSLDEHSLRKVDSKSMESKDDGVPEFQLCSDRRDVIGCGGHAVIARNPMGSAYYHVLLEMLPSIAYLLEFVASNNGNVTVLDNLCIPGEGIAATRAWQWDWRLRFCFGRGPTAFLVQLFELLGVGVQSLQHYPHGRQRNGPSVFLRKATLDCAEGYPANFWHLHKLRSLLHARMPQPSARRAIVVMNRNACQEASTNRSTTSGPAQRLQRGECHRGREVVHHRRILDALRISFPEFEVIDARGDRSVMEQATQFWRAAIVVGPYGAGLSNMIFCQQGTPVVEFLVGGGSRSSNPKSSKSKSKRSLPYPFFFAGYAHVFALPYWAIISEAADNTLQGIDADVVVDTVALALSLDGRKRTRYARRATEEMNSDFMRDGYGAFHPALYSQKNLPRHMSTAWTRVGW